MHSNMYIVHVHVNAYLVTTEYITYVILNLLEQEFVAHISEVRMHPA